MSFSKSPLAEPLLTRLLVARSVRGSGKILSVIAFLIGLCLTVLWVAGENQPFVGRPIETDGEENGEGGEGGGEEGEKAEHDIYEKTGLVQSWLSNRAFGFIQPDDGGEILFCHVRSLVDGEGSVSPGDKVSYVAEYNERKGKHEASNVRFVSKGEAPEGDGAEAKGKVVKWNEERGFGFLELADEEGADNVFLHKQNMVDPDSFEGGVQEGDEVEFKKSFDLGRQKWRAAEVKFVSRPPPEEEGHEDQEGEENQGVEGEDEPSAKRAKQEEE